MYEAAPHHLELYPCGRKLDVARRIICRVIPCRIGNNLRRMHFCNEAQAIGVILVHHHGVHLLKQAFLGGKIVFECAVIVQMVLREVREHTHFKLQPPQPKLIQGLAGGLHDGKCTARQHHAAEQGVQVPRFRRSKFRRNLHLIYLVMYSSNQARLIARLLQHLFDHGADRCFAIGTRHGYQAQLFRRVPKIVCAQTRICFAAVFHLHFALQAQGALCHNACRACLQRLLRKCVPICRMALCTHKHSPRPGPARILRHKGHIPLRQCAGIFHAGK